MPGVLSGTHSFVIWLESHQLFLSKGQVSNVEFNSDNYTTIYIILTLHKLL